MNENVKYCPACSDGLVEFDHDTYQCQKCNHLFEIKEDQAKRCDICGGGHSMRLCPLPDPWA